MWVAVGIFVIVALLFVQRRAPWNDEGWFADASLNLAYKGYMGTSVIEPTGTHLPTPPSGIAEYTYWVLPLYLLVQAGWYKVVGFSPFLMRLPGVFWALALLWSVHRVAGVLTGRRDIARLAVCLLAVETLFVNVATLGRMDIMAAGLSWLALAAYLHWREKNLHLAILIAYGLAGAACMTHHQSILGVLALIGMTLYLDRSRLTVGMVFLAALPVALMASGWAIYAMQRPDYFQAQIASNGARRFNFIYNPLETIQWEFTRRFTYYGFYPGRHWIRRVLVLVPLAYLACLLIAAFVPAIRRMPGLKLIVGICAAQWLYQITLDGMKLHLYLIHLWPSLTIVLAAVLYYLWYSRMAARPLLAAFVLAWVTIGLGSSAMLIIKNNYKQTVQPLRQALERRMPPRSSIYGPPELGLYIGFNHLIDDLRLGYHTGKIPDYIVMDIRSRAWLDKNETSEPEMVRRARSLLDRAEVVYSDSDYRLYRVANAGR
jgi:4-amino-4-deoxy-L-arabinose transferase-like glycosyltransferase